VQIGADSYPMLIDSGAMSTTIEPETADAWHLPEDTSRAIVVRGVGGSVGSIYPRILPSLKLGPSEWPDLRVMPLHTDATTRRSKPDAPVGILGVNVLSHYDLDFDFLAHTLSFYSETDCIGRYAPWTGDYQAFSAAPSRANRVVIDASLNGHPFRALLETGSVNSMVSKAAADAAGVDSAALAQDVAVSGSGVDGATVTTYRHWFDMTVGNLRFRRAPLLVADTRFSDADMLLGMDFMKYRRVWVSYSTGWVFMQLVPGSAEGPVTAQGGPESSPRTKFHVMAKNLSSGNAGTVDAPS
jgi:hypothetical protein